MPRMMRMSRGSSAAPTSSVSAIRGAYRPAAWGWDENGPMDARLGQRDLEALRWVGEQYACRLDQLQVLLGRLGGRGALSASAARSVVSRWETLGMAARGSFIAGEPSWVWLTRQGLRQAGLAFRVVEPKPWTLPHTAVVARPAGPAAQGGPADDLPGATG